MITPTIQRYPHLFLNHLINLNIQISPTKHKNTYAEAIHAQIPMIINQNAALEIKANKISFIFPILYLQIWRIMDDHYKDPGEITVRIHYPPYHFYGMYNLFKNIIPKRASFGNTWVICCFFTY